jgi:hypothetical protein
MMNDITIAIWQLTLSAFPNLLRHHQTHSECNRNIGGVENACSEKAVFFCRCWRPADNTSRERRGVISGFSEANIFLTQSPPSATQRITECWLFNF